MVSGNFRERVGVLRELSRAGGAGLAVALLERISRSILRSAFDVDAGGSGPALRRAHADVDHVSEAEPEGCL